MLKHAHMIGPRHPLRLTAAFSLAVLSAVLLFGQVVEAEESTTPVTEERVALTPAELEELVGPIALYPDDLVSIVLPASTYPLQIVQAARYLDAHKTDPELKPDEDWDDSVVALLNYPEVIELMNADLDWTWKLGEAALYQQAELLDAIQDFRDRAYAAGNLKSDKRQVVTKNGETIAIEPVDPKVIYVPYYEPDYVVVYQPYPVYHYYPRAYPVYYYPYPYGYSFNVSYFWGITLAFSIDWHSHHVHVHHRHHHAHPYYGRYYHYPWYRRHSVSVSYRETIWRPSHYSGARQRHTAWAIKENRRLGATAPSRKGYRTHNGPRLRKSVPHTAKRVTRPSRTAHGRNPAASSSHRATRPSTAAHRRNLPASSSHRVTRPRNHSTRRPEVTRPRNHSTRRPETVMRRPETITRTEKTTRARERTRTRKTVPPTAPAKRQATRPSRTRTQATHKSRDVRSGRPSSSRSRRSTVSNHRRQPSAVFERRGPRARGRI